MGKAKKLKVSGTTRPGPLGDQIRSDDFAAPTSRPSKARQRTDEEDVDKFVDGKLSEKILSQARQQVKDLESEEIIANEIKGSKKETKITNLKSVSSDEESDGDDNENIALLPDGGFDGQGFAKEIRISGKDQEAFDLFMNRDAPPRKTLADLINEKINEKRTEIDTQFSESSFGGPEAKADIDPAVIEMYEGVGKVLARYRSGKIPKAFKVIAQFQNWEELLVLTRPDEWTAAAMYKATKIFTANLKEKMAQRFFNQVLLPRILDDIITYQRLNFHLYQAIGKALFKPGAFFKGFLLPLCEGGQCTLRMAIIIGSMLAKRSIPMMHSAAVMLKIAEMEYSGANSIFLRILFDKKYALPYRVVDSVVFHFLRFRNERRELPVLWHQSLLTFVQRYKGHVSSEQKEALMELLRVHSQGKITPEIRRELVHSACRDEEIKEPVTMDQS